MRTKLHAKLWMTRWNLLLWVVFAIAICISGWHLFPGALFWVDGGLRGILLVSSVDFVLGPLLCFLVANPAKSLRERRTDLAILTTVQIVAMAWGGWTLYTQRPVAISYMREGFALPVTMEGFQTQKISPHSLPSSQLSGLPAFFVDLPEGKEGALVYYTAIKKPIPLTAQADLLKPLFSHDRIYFNAARFQSYWAGQGASDWHDWASRHGNKPATDYRFILFAGRYGNAALVLDTHNTLLGHLPLPDGPPDVILPGK